MKPVGRWAVLASLILAVSGIIIFAAWRTWQSFTGTVGRPLDEEGREVLKTQLAESPRSIFIFDPLTSYRLKPSFKGLRHDSETMVHVTNSAGILGEKEINPDPSVKKILFLGDSVAYGSYLPYQEVFISLMQEMAGRGYQFLNAGCPGWSTHQELTAYLNYFAGIPVEAVVIIFSLNDLLRFEWVWRDDRSFQMSAELIGLGGMLDSWRTARALREIRRRFKEEPALAPLATLNNTCLCAYLPERWRDFTRENQPLLEEMAKNTAVILVAVPVRAQLEALNSGAGEVVVLHPQVKLRQLCLNCGVEFIGALPAFRSGDGSYDTTFFLPGEKGELHLSEGGHRRMAEYLWPGIKAALSQPGEDTAAGKR